MKIRKIIAVFTVIALCLCVFSVPASAAASIKVSRNYKNGYTLVTAEYSSGYKLYYTSDGSEPDTSSARYTGTLRVKKPLTLRFAAYKNGKCSKTISCNIKVRAASPEVKLLTYNGDTAQYTVKAPIGSAVYMTSDGSKPTKSNGKIVGGSSFTITLSENGKYRFRAYKDGWEASSVRTVKVDELTEGTGTQTVSGGAASSGGYSDYAEEILRLVNIEREKAGLKPLKLSEKLCAAAQVRAVEIKDKMSHTRPNGKSFNTAIKEAGVSYSYAGENIAGGYRTPADVVKRWMNSAGHRKNILNKDFNYLGVGMCTGGYYSINWVQLFTS